MSEFAGLSDVQPLATNFITGEIVKINDEHGEATLRQGPIAHVHLSARTTILHYVPAKVIFRVEADDKAWFRPDRANDGNPAAVLGVPGPIRARHHRVQLSKNGVNRT